GADDIVCRVSEVPIEEEFADDASATGQAGDASENGDSGEKRVSWAELFFDLVFVLAVTEISSLLHVDHSWAGAGRALVLFVPIYWAWVGISIYVNTHAADDPSSRVGIFAVGLAGMLMALAVPDAFGDRGVLFGASYFGARIVMGWLMFRGDGIFLSPFAIALFFSGPLLLLGGLLPYSPRIAIWAVVAFVDLSTPTTLRKRLQNMRFQPGHLAERFGLFLLIAIGESVAAIGATAASRAHIGLDVLVAVALAFVLAGGLWWVYFQYAADAMRFALATAEVQTVISRHVLTYGHLPFIGAIITVAVGMREVIANPSTPLGWAVTALLYGGCAIYLATFNYTRWKMFRKWSPTRSAGAVAVGVLLPAAPFLPGVVALAMLAVVLVALNVVEYLRVKRAGGL
ncbi:MAG: low temperature requirement protein A, partial [Sciscionella sp.]|nr:low temperature requirement protein A [Sciscionella sp.]